MFLQAITEKTAVDNQTPAGAGPVRDQHDRMEADSADFGFAHVQATSFLAGVAIAGSFALYQLRQDLWDSHAILAAQVIDSDTTVQTAKRDTTRASLRVV
ncbi:hypothetical protein MMC07_006579 [Pseudocyphellaria aurata]|nr:hypothetical protein [Pseudocyphellaria aurata]